MVSHKNIDRICIFIIIIALIGTILFMNADKFGVQRIVDEDAESYTGTEHFTANDLNGEWSTDSATIITCSGSDITISGNGAYAYDGSVYISNGGYYVISGTLDDGFIDVDAYSSSKIWIMLDNLDITCSDNACFRVDQADKVFLTLAGGSVNTFTDSDSISEEAENDGTNGTIYAHDDLTINGSGTLNINGNYYHGIKAKDDLTITGGTINITAAQDGIHVNNDFATAGATITVTTGDDGIHADDGIYIESGTITIDKCYEGIEASTIEVAGGDITIYPSDDGFNANGIDSSMGMGGGGFGGGRGGFDRMNESGNVSDTAGTAEGSDSGKASGRPEMETSADMPEEAENSTASEEDECYILISGGNVTIINENGNDADGLDSNKDIYITGGNIYISLNGSGSNNAIDYGSENNGVAEISGGTIVAAGGANMAEGFDSSSTQASIFYIYSAGAEAGTRVTLEDSEGNTLIDTEIAASFSCLTLSCPEMQVGESYVLFIGDEAEEITLEEMSASYGDAQSSGFGGTMNWGGMQSGENFGGRGGHGGMSGRGGKMGRFGENSSEVTESGETVTDGAESGERPELPEGFSFEDGERPELPDGVSFEDGEMPEPPEGFGSEDGEIPERPEGDSETEDGERPRRPEDMGSEGAQSSGTDTEAQSGETQMNHMHGQGGDFDRSQMNEFEDTADTTTSTKKEVTTEEWLWIGISLIASIGAIIFAKSYRR